MATIRSSKKETVTDNSEQKRLECCLASCDPLLQILFLRLQTWQRFSGFPANCCG